VPEGPSIVILKEEADGFVGRKVTRVRGNSREPIQRIEASACARCAAGASTS
jgi:hypothetical protein